MHEQQPAEEVPRLDATLDDELSKRLLQLDPAGYFIIYVDRQASAKSILGGMMGTALEETGAAAHAERTGEQRCPIMSMQGGAGDRGTILHKHDQQEW